MPHPQYEVIYNSWLLDELHNLFPALLYRPQQFRTVADVLEYIRSQAQLRYNLFSVGERSYNMNFQDVPTPPPPPMQPMRSARPAEHFNIPPPATPMRQPLPSRPQPPPQHPPFMHDIAALAAAMPPNVDEFNITLEALPIPPLAQPQPFGRDSNITWGTSGSRAMLDVVSSLLGLPLTTTRLPSLPVNLDPVIVRPTAAEIDRGTAIEVVDAEEEVCAICQDTMEAGSQARSINACDHRFHTVCIDTWFQQNVRCPVCRHDIRDPPRVEEEDHPDSE